MMFEDGINPNELDIRVKTQAYAFDISNSNNISVQNLDFFSQLTRFMIVMDVR